MAWTHVPQEAALSASLALVSFHYGNPANNVSSVETETREKRDNLFNFFPQIVYFGILSSL